MAAGTILPTPGVTARATSMRHFALPPLVRFVLRRALIGVGLAFVVSLLTFTAVQVLPGDAARAVLGGRTTDAQLVVVREQLGLDRPVVQRYVDWLGGVVSGDLGTSLRAQLPVSQVIADPMRNSLVLALVALLVLIPVSVGLGLAAGLRRGGWVDSAITTSTLAIIAVPEFVVGTILILVFAVDLGWLPPVSLVAPGADPLATPDVLVLPVATLVLVGSAYTARMVRASVIEVARSEFVEAARLAGMPSGYVVRQAILRNSLAPAIQVIMQTVQWLIGGVVVVEAVFGFPGIGTELVGAVATRDLPEVQSLTLLIALAFVALNLLADVLVVLLIPKLRTSQ